MRDAGASRLYLKYLSPNDNSKNQPYFGGSFDVLNILPLASEFTVERPDSNKPAVNSGTFRMKAALNFYWLDDDGELHHAPGAQLILYPQYPEVRFSGFNRGASWSPAELMNEKKRGREEGRVLFLGVTLDGTVLGYLAAPESAAARQAHDQALEPTVAVFAAIDLAQAETGEDSLHRLMAELRRIHLLEWIKGKTLLTDGTLRPCNASNCGGHTLEAELGITPNGYAEPDFLGWEVKQHDVHSLERPRSHAVTLFTPNPDMGDYVSLSLADFVRRYGYQDRTGRPDRLNFGGVHRHGERQKLTTLTLTLQGYDVSRPTRFDASGGVVLQTPDGLVAAGWSFAKLLEHWNRKHNQAVYVPSESRKNGSTYYRYGRRVQLGQGTDFTKLLAAIHAGALYYDPGIKLEMPAGKRPRTKSRSQFRMKSTDLGALYYRWSEMDVIVV